MPLDPPLRPSDPILFLDIDGVLNTHDTDWAAGSCPIHRDKVMLVNYILTATGAALVLSSAWRYCLFRDEMNLVGMQRLLSSHGLMTGRLAGITRPDTMVPDPAGGPMPDERGRQILDWRALNGHAGRSCVIDDLNLGITAARLPFVRTDGRVGLTEADAALAIMILDDRCSMEYVPSGRRPTCLA